jgi:2-polyprenyl-3-methyl-5-hydroxy-6-metoxy-1,4-benzoquinol methylase
MHMDEQTIDAYDSTPAMYASEWEEQPPPVDLQKLVLQFFRPGPTADVGCGSGREAAWMYTQGFEVVGFDRSMGLLGEARRRHPEIEFREAALPDLNGIEHGSFENVLCETVIMHLPAAEIPVAAESLTAILKPEGTLYLSWRVTEREDQRLEDGRLYSAFEAEAVLDALSGMTVLHDSEATSASSGRLIHRIVARRETD